MRRIDFCGAIREAMWQEMERDPSVFVYGIGVPTHAKIFGSVTGLTERFGPDRCFDTPISEEAMTGFGLGAAINGMRPIHIHIRVDFLLLAMNQLVNMAAKCRYMYGGTVSVPLVIRVVVGRSWGQGPQHSQALHALFMHVPGLRVLAPTTPYDAKGCLRQALEDRNPVLFNLTRGERVTVESQQQVAAAQRSEQLSGMFSGLMSQAGGGTSVVKNNNVVVLDINRVAEVMYGSTGFQSAVMNVIRVRGEEARGYIRR